MGKIADNVIRIPTTSADGNFFRYWFEILKPFHKLTDRETDVLTAIAKRRHDLAKVISDENILNQVLMNEESRVELRNILEMSSSQFQSNLSKLKKNNIMVDNAINPRFIPNLKEDEKYFKLLFLFELK